MADTTRAGVAALAVSFEGTDDGQGYDGANPFSADLGRSPEAWCFDFATDVFKRAGLLLPSMQRGCSTGGAFVPDGWDYAGNHGARKPSWQALAADFAIFDWNGDGQADHIEPVVEWVNGVLHTCGGNSGASNEPGDRWQGTGGVHRHQWIATVGQGNANILGIIDTSKLVTFGAPAKHTPSHTAPPYPLLQLKSAPIHNHHVLLVQQKLHDRGLWGATPDGTYGKTTEGAVWNFQHLNGLTTDGKVGLQTYHALGINP